MKRHDALTKGLALAGTVLLALTLVAPVLFALARLVQSGRIRVDWLMPAELFPLALLGGVLVVAAAIRAADRRALIGWSAGLMLAFFVGINAIAVLSGLASGAREATGLPWLATIASLVGYICATAVACVGGILLSKDLFAADDQPTPAQPAPTT